MRQINKFNWGDTLSGEATLSVSGLSPFEWWSVLKGKGVPSGERFVFL